MRFGFLSLGFFLISCANNLKPESKNIETYAYLPEIQYLLESRVPISEEMKAKKFPETWRGNLQSSLKNYKVSLGSSSLESRSMSIEVELKEDINRTRHGRQKEFFFEKGKIHIIRNSEPFNVPDQGSFQGYYGILFKFQNGELESLGCYFQQDPCGEAIHLNPRGEVTKVTREKNQCKKGCGHLIPYRIPGSYFIADNKVRVRKEPSTKSEIITELNKDTPIEVVADAEVYEEVFPHYGTWGKVKLDDGQEGYVYGAFLRAPAEPDVVAIREKAEEWKKKNGWKGK